MWNLFRGRKHNPLKQRIDSCDFDLEQLLLGTVLFTMLIFLFPTIAFYYVCFSVLAATLALLRAIIHIFKHIIGLFPYYGLTLSFVDKKSLSGGLIVQPLWFNSSLNIDELQDNHSLKSKTAAKPSHLPFDNNDDDLSEQQDTANTQLRSSTPLTSPSKLQRTGDAQAVAVMLLQPSSIERASLFCELEALLKRRVTRYHPSRVLNKFIEGTIQ